MCINISTIIVSLNCSNTIENAILSFVNQRYDYKELLIIDGGSTDGTVDVIKKYDKYISYWISETDSGIYDAMNKGILHANGDYIAFLGADDYYLDGTFEKVSRIIKQNMRYNIFCFNIKWILNNKLVTPPSYKGFHDPEQLRYIGNVFPHQAVFAKKQLFEIYGLFNIKYKILADYEWLLRIYNEGEKFLCRDIPVVAFGKSGISSIQRKKALLECGEIICNVAKENRFLEEKKSTAYYFTSDQIAHHFFISLIEYLNNSEEIIFTRKKMSILEKKKAIIFGIGNNGKCCYRWLKRCEIPVVEFWDNYANEDYKMLDLIVRKPYFKSLEDEVIILTCYNSFFEVYDQLEKMGYKFDKDFIGAGALVLGCGE